MKILTALFTGLLTAMLLLSFIAVADARSRHKKKKVYRSQHSYQSERAYRARTRARRPYSVGYNGLCQRDTGTATSNLNFRNGCDVEEFWRRQEENAGGHR